MSEITEWRHCGEDDKEPFEYRGCGLDGIYLRSGYEMVSTPHGEGLKIKNIEGLHKAIGAFLVVHKKALAPKDIRFLRKEMDLTQDELGALVCVDGQSVARWEKGKTPLSGPADGLLRILYLGTINGALDPMAMLAKFRESDDPEQDAVFFDEQAGQWHSEAA